MKARKLSICLAEIEEQLTCGIESLRALESPDQYWPESFCAASQKLAELEILLASSGERAAVIPQLQAIQERARTAETLLDSAASFYFGRILSRASIVSGYQPGGDSSEEGGGCLRIEG